MPITTALQVVTWSILFSSLSILWVSELLSPLLVAAGYGAIGISAVRVRLEARPWFSTAIWRLLTLGALAMFVVEWVVLGDGLLNASLHLLLFLMVYKLLTLAHSRDYLHLYLIGFFQLLASTTAAAALPYGLIFLLYVVLSPWTLMLYTLQQEAEQQAASGQLPIIRWPFFVTTTATAVGTFVLTLAIFFVIPRMGSGFLQQAGTEPVKLIGFSERVDLGTIGAVKLDPTIVMRVSVSSPTTSPLPPFYWRGTAYDYYDGTSWQNRLAGRRAVSRDVDGRFTIFSLRRVATPSPDVVRQDMILEPLETAILFAAANPVAVGGQLPSLRIDGQGTLLLPVAPASRFRYEVDSVLPRLVKADATVTVADEPRVPPVYVQLPAGSERLVELAKQVAGVSKAGVATAADLSPMLSVLEQAQRIESYLKRNYRYTLDVKPPVRLSAIDDFLFEQKAGYCEYYATAMVLMLRGLGIPARMVSGFMEGEWNQFGRYYTVREQDAHTWVEVYFPRSGWMPFDPTPAVSQSSPMVFGRLRQLADTLWVSWERYIIRFSLRDQWAVIQEMRTQGTTWQMRSVQWMDAGKMQLAAAVSWVFHHREFFLLIVAVGCFVLLVMRWWVQRHGGWPFRLARPLRQSQLHGQTFYAKLLRRLASRGLPKPAAMTPLEFLRSARPKLGSTGDAVEQLTDYYHRLRFGAVPLTHDDQREISRLLRQVEQGELVGARAEDSFPPQSS